MALAMIHPVPEKGGRGKLSRDGTVSEVSKQRLSLARAVLHYDQKLAQRVLDGPGTGGVSLDEAYAKLRQDQGYDANRATRVRTLREQRPDLADEVAEERLSLEDAEKIASKDAAELKQQRWAITVNLVDAVVMLFEFGFSGLKGANFGF